MDKEKKKILDDMKTIIEKQYGKGILTTLDEQPIYDADRIIKTGSIGLDIALGIGGYPRGRIVEIFGPEMGGKTTLALHAIAHEQAKGNTCAFIDTEHALDVIYAANLGVQTSSELLLSQPDYGEQALNIVEMLARSGAISLIVVDSVAALTPKAELEGEMGDHHVGTMARLMSQAMRKLVSVTNETGTCIIFINQIRMKIGVMFGSPETTTGGNALKFYASQRLDIRRIGQIKDSKENVKNKVAPPFKQAEFNIMFGVGIERMSEVLEYALMDGLMEKKGSWYKYGDDNIAQGAKNAVVWLKENPEILEKLSHAVLEARGLL
jgi:recombination protein RecA